MSNSSSEDDQVKKLLENKIHLKRKKSVYNKRYYERKKTKNIKNCNNIAETELFNQTVLLNNASFADNLTNYNEDFLDNDISQINEDQEDLGEIEYQSEFTSETESGNETVYSSQESLNLSEESIEECEFTYENSNTTIKDLAMSFLAIKYMHKLSDIVLDDILLILLS